MINGFRKYFGILSGLLAILIAVVIFAFLLPKQEAEPIYSNGIVFGSVINIPGIIQAEEFNNGGMNTAYRSDTAGNQGDADFRTGEDVDVYKGGSGMYIQSSEGNGFFEWLKYSVNVKATGWYCVEFAGRSSGNVDAGVSVLFDDAFISRATLPAEKFATVSADRPVYLTSGAHTMKVLLSMIYSSGKAGLPALDYINVAGTSFIPTEPAAMATTLSKDEVTIAGRR